MNESRLRLLDLDDLEYKDEDFWKHEKSYRKSVKLEKINWTYICTVVFICWQVWQINFSWMSWYKITNLIIILGTFQTKYWWGPSPSMTIVSWCININSITARNCGYKKNVFSKMLSTYMYVDQFGTYYKQIPCLHSTKSRAKMMSFHHFHQQVCFHIILIFMKNVLIRKVLILNLLTEIKYVMSLPKIGWNI